MRLVIKKPGILTTVQDVGRVGYRRFGINPGGVMDTAATRIANTIVGNEVRGAVLEMHFPAPEIEFETDTCFAITGADFGASLDGKPVRNWSSHRAGDGSLLRFATRISGQRSYFAVCGGIRADQWLDSYSTNLVAGLGGVKGRRLAAGDRLEIDGDLERPTLGVGVSLLPRYSRFPTVRIIEGCEFGRLTSISERDFLSQPFTLTNNCDRMGYRLEGRALHLTHRIETVSSGVGFGTIQLLPDGQLIVLMADHQTSGGYPRVGNVISVDLPILAQCGPGDGVSFEMVSIGEAESLRMQFEKELNYLRVGCKLQTQNANR